jgi:hypothetical protein
MAEGWLPPQAPGGQPPPRFDMVVPEPVAERAPSVERPEPVPPRFAGPAPARRAASDPEPTNGLALTALILGILGIALLAVTLGLGFIFALPCSVAAWMCGAQARNRINLGEATRGRGQANLGYLLGVAGVVIGVAAAIGWVIWVVNGGDFEQLQRDLERWRDEQARQAVIHTARALLGR